MTENNRNLFFEILERSLRLANHIRRSIQFALQPVRSKTAQDIIALHVEKQASSYSHRSITIYFSSQSEKVKRRMLLEIIEEMAECHRRTLSAVPRNREPVELVSYLRQVRSTDTSKKITKDLLVFATESLGDQAHANFYLPNATSLFEETLNPSPCEIKDPPISEEPSGPIGYVSLPRIDLSNPLRWPSLLHEIAHFEAPSEIDLWKDFEATFPDVISELIFALGEYFERQSIPDAAGSIDYGDSHWNLRVIDELKSWLLECWCDIYATRQTGAPILFSLALAFSFNTPLYLSSRAIWKLYPPAWFRLRIIKIVLISRSKEDIYSNKVIEDAYNYFSKVFVIDDHKTNCLENILSQFQQFLRLKFPEDQWNQQSFVDESAIATLVEDLENAFPIPSFGQNDLTKTRATTHAEILLAGWSYRQGKFKDALIAEAKKLYLETGNIKSLLAIVERADLTLQASIQSAEWYKILVKHPAASEPSTLHSDKSASSPGLLTDQEIYDFLSKRDLRIIPCLNALRDIRGTAIDLRLGHNFEIFFPNVRGAYDPLDSSREPIPSSEIGVDSTHFLELMPGQFVLAHTLEYISLPDNIAGQIEGRSSLARLGVQIHMTANLVEAGFSGCLTLEIANQGHSAVRLYPGLRIAQIRLFKLPSPPLSSYRAREAAKFSGGLRHRTTRPFEDWEAELIVAEAKRREVEEGK